MKIDFEATRHNMRLLRIGRYAAERGIPIGTLTRILAGNYGDFKGPKYHRVLDILRADGYLVEVPDGVESMAA